MKKFFSFLVLVVILAAAAYFVVIPYFSPDEADPSTNTQTLTFDNIGELATQEADIVQVETLEKDFLKEEYNISLPFGTTKVIYSYMVEVKAGYDFTQITAEVDEEAKTVTVQMPDAEVLSSEVLTDTFKSYLDEQSVFNQLTQEDQNNALAQLKSDAEETALNSGLLEKARQNGEVLITNMILNILGSTDYEIIFA
jgi:hypothetical protein